MTSRISTEGFTNTPRAILERPSLEADAAVWAGLLDEWLGRENDIYARLLDRSDASTCKSNG